MHIQHKGAALLCLIALFQVLVVAGNIKKTISDDNPELAKTIEVVDQMRALAEAARTANEVLNVSARVASALTAISTSIPFFALAGIALSFVEDIIGGRDPVLDAIYALS